MLVSELCCSCICWLLSSAPRQASPTSLLPSPPGTALSCERVIDASSLSTSGQRTLQITPKINPDTELVATVKELATVDDVPPLGLLLKESGIAKQWTLWKAPQEGKRGNWRKREFVLRVLREKRRGVNSRTWKLTYHDAGTHDEDSANGTILLEDVDCISAWLVRDRG